MMKVTRSTKIFVMCVGNVVTGGAELLHQLVDKLSRLGHDAYIHYYDTDNAGVPDAYSKYHVKVALEIEDLSENIVVYYEACFHLIRRMKNSQLLLWWLSVDNFFICSSFYLSLIDQFKFNKRQFLIGLYMRLKRNRAFVNALSDQYSIRDLSRLNALNVYQSEYAQNFLINNKFKCTFSLGDYINTDFSDSIETKSRNNIILYNPKKGLAFTKKIIASMPGRTFVAIENLSRKEIVDLMASAKLYLDFGYHPGKDRLPREAALMGCCIITGMRGSARFYEDVAINNQYKFDEKRNGLQSIISRIEDVMENYEDNIVNFEFYRNRIRNEKQVFESEVEAIFKVNY